MFLSVEERLCFEHKIGFFESLMSRFQTVSFLINFILAREVEEHGNIRTQDSELWVASVTES